MINNSIVRHVRFIIGHNMFLSKYYSLQTLFYCVGIPRFLESSFKFEFIFTREEHYS